MPYTMVYIDLSKHTRSRKEHEMTHIAQEFETLAQLREAAKRNQTDKQAQTIQTGIKWTLTKIAIAIDTANSPSLTFHALQSLTHLPDRLFVENYLENAKS
jgi:hypothetical protein